ncbi:MAG: PAS-domain containing protein [Candidatus Paracaedibacteraceae bacterium]|nr:PAS-domain containing protein [Candidatus Paracaedibacteraceae bacterium]
MLDNLLYWISIDEIEPLIIALAGIIIGALFVAVLAFRYIQKLRTRVYLLKDRHVLYKILIDSAVESRCWWPKNGGNLECSYNLIELLGLDPVNHIFIQDIINQFVADDAYKLDQNITNLRESNNPFELTLTLVEERSKVKVVGYTFTEKEEQYCVLAFSDISEEDFLLDRLHSKVTELYNERNFLKDALDNIPIAIWGRDTDKNLTYCNLVYSGVLDTTNEDALHNQRELIDRSRTSSPYNLANRALLTKQPQSKRTHVVIDGHRRLLEVCETPVSDKTIGYAMDYTEQEEVHAILAKHVSAHQDILHNLSTPIVVYGTDKRLEFFNKAYEKLFDFDEKFLYSKPTFSEILQDLRERRKLPEVSDFITYRNSQLGLFNTLITPIQELVHLPDGQILRMMISPHPMGGLLFLFDDVTDKLAMERRYNTLIAVQKETLDHLYEGIIVLGSDNRLRLSNSAAARIWQIENIEFAPERHAGEILYEIRHRFKGYTQWDSFRQKALELFNHRQPQIERVILADDSVIQVSYVPLPDGSHMLGFVDVSDRWRFEEALKERNQALEQADKFKSDFISHVSYELRAPLNTIIGFTEIMLQQYFGSLNERQVDYCEGINDSSQRLLSLINDIIDFASVEAGQLSLKIHPIELDSFLDSLVALIFNRSNDHGLEVICHNNTKIKRFLADERRLKQSIFNLLMNAIKYTPSGGLIEIIADIESDEDGDNLVFTVHDNGIGISAEQCTEIQELFESKRTRLKGPGIGLPLVKSFIGLHGGTVHIDSGKDKGTVAKCRIPLIEEPKMVELNLGSTLSSTEPEISANHEA